MAAGLRKCRVVRKRLKESGYVAAANADAKSNHGMWTINSKRQVIYARSDLDLQQRQAAAQKLCAELNAAKAG
jgi:hypothetical protein